MFMKDGYTFKLIKNDGYDIRVTAKCVQQRTFTVRLKKNFMGNFKYVVIMDCFDFRRFFLLSY